MGTNFNIKYNSIMPSLVVEQDGKLVSKYSQFSHCESIPFWKWYKSISEFCLNEANGMYAIHFVGGLTLGTILKKEFNAQKDCCRFSFEPDFITGEDRMHLIEELLCYSKIHVKKKLINISFDSNNKVLFNQIEMLVTDSNTLQYLDLRELPIYLCIEKEASYTSNIFIVSSIEEFYQIANSRSSALPRLIIIVQNKNIRFIDEINNCFLFACDINSIYKVIKEWISDILFPEYARTIINCLKNCHRWSNIDYQSAIKMVDSLCSNTPYLDLSVTERIEIGSVGKFKLTKFPNDIPCRVYSSNAGIALLGSGGIIKPIGEGGAEIIAEVKDYPTNRISKKITVFKYKKVQKIYLNATNKNIVVGDRITVTCDCVPRDANNISLGRWEIVPNDRLRIISNMSGTFQALKPGRCEIVFKVGDIYEQLSIEIFPKPSSIDFVEKSMSVKLYDSSQRVITVVYPQGSKGGIIKYKISDTSVLDLDCNNGQITPKREGISVITAILLDNNGTIIDDCNCTITIIPPKDVVTPNGALVLIIVALIGSLLLINNECRFLCGIIGFIGAVWYSLKEKSIRAYITSIILLIAIIFLIFIGGMATNGY